MLEVTGLKNLRKTRVAIIGAGGAAKAIAYAVKKLGGKACIFNRTIAKARALGKKYGFDYASLGQESIITLKKYNDLIIQTTSKGMGSTEVSNSENDPLWFYDFAGTEMIYDIIYKPEITPIMARAAKSGCKVSNGFTMLQYQGEEQFRLFKTAK